MNIGENIKQIRESKKISQEQLSNISGVPRTSLGRYERGERNPNIDTIKQIAEALEVPTFMLTGESEVMDLFAGTSRLNRNSRLINELHKLAFNKKTLDTTPVIHTIEQHKIDLCEKVIHELGYTVERDNNIIKINDDSRVIKTIKVDLIDFVELSKNIHWALESFVEKFIDEHSMGLIEDDEEIEWYEDFSKIPKKGMHNRKEGEDNGE